MIHQRTHFKHRKPTIFPSTWATDLRNSNTASLQVLRFSCSFCCPCGSFGPPLSFCSGVSLDPSPNRQPSCRLVIFRRLCRCHVERWPQKSTASRLPVIPSTKYYVSLVGYFRPCFSTPNTRATVSRSFGNASELHDLGGVFIYFFPNRSC